MTELDATPEGWDEELTTAMAGLDAAIRVMQDRKGRKGRRSAPDGSQPVYGMPGRRFAPGRGMT